MKREKYLFLLPSAAGVIIFWFVPLLDLVRRSFCTAVTEKFCGWTNYRTIFSNTAFHLAVRNTLRFVLICLPLLIVLSLLLAVLLSGARWMQAIKSMYLFPLAVPSATVVLVWKLLFCKEGMFNGLLAKFGIGAVDWMNSREAFAVLVVSYLWKNLGYTMILWLAGIGQISKEILEAALVDGADHWQRFWYVIWPNLKSTLYMITILSFLNSFKVFREAYLVAGNYPQESIYLLQHLFNNWFVNLELDKMAAAAVCVSVVFLLSILVFQRLWQQEG